MENHNSRKKKPDLLGRNVRAEKNFLRFRRNSHKTTMVMFPSINQIFNENGKPHPTKQKLHLPCRVEKFVPKIIFTDFNETHTKQQWRCYHPLPKFSSKMENHNSRNKNPTCWVEKFEPKTIFSDFDETHTKQQW